MKGANPKQSLRGRGKGAGAKRARYAFALGPRARVLLWLVFMALVLMMIVPPAVRSFLVARDEGGRAFVDVYCGTNLPSSSGRPLRPQAPSTQRMVERLEAATREALKNPSRSAYMSQAMVEYLREELARATTPQVALNHRVQMAVQLLNAGQSREALEAFESIEAMAPRAGVSFNHKQRGQLRLLRALCWLRVGEQENCLVNHTSESCLIPVREPGVHRLSEGSRGAVALLEEHLGQFPTDLKAIWLLNIAYMTLGEFPNQVPTAWRLPPGTFDSDYDIKRFPDAAGAAGLDVNGLAGGVIAEDFNRDGLLDVMFSDWASDGPLRLFLNDGRGGFVERSGEAGLTGLTGGLNLMQTDYNNDGHLDVFVTRGGWLGESGRHPNSLLRNHGDGTFDDVTEEAGLLSFYPTQTAVWLDFDGDGWLDVFIGNESMDLKGHPCELYRNNGNGTFTECAAESGVAVARFVKGVTSGDFNNDGRPDLYVSARDGSNLLFRNDGPATGGRGAWRFTEVGIGAGVDHPLRSFPTWFFDYDNDGWSDLFVSDYGGEVTDVAADYLDLPGQAEKAKLFRNNRDGTFKDVSEEVGLDRVLIGMGANYGDLDNDGWLDFYVGTGDPDLSTLIPNRMFRNNAGLGFQDVTTSGGFGHIQKGHGVAFADLDNDGDQDVVLKVGGAYSGDIYRSALFMNPGHGGHWITLKLEGDQSNRAAIGARIRVVLETAGGERSVYKTVNSGGSFGASPLRQEIGLGDALRIQRVEVFWPATGQTQTLAGMEMDRFYEVREGRETALAWEVPRRLPMAAGAPPGGGHAARGSAPGG